MLQIEECSETVAALEKETVGAAPVVAAAAAAAAATAAAAQDGEGGEEATEAVAGTWPNLV